MKRVLRILAALAAAGAGWTLAASIALLLLAGAWGHPHFARGLHWTWAWWSYAAEPAARQAGMGALSRMLISACAATLAVAAAYRFARGGRKDGRRSDLHGETHWLPREEAEAGGITFHKVPPSDGIVLGKSDKLYACLRGEEHVALYARTRAGKGVSFVVPNCQNWGGGLVCFSVKRDVIRWAAAERERLGDEVFVFDPTAPNQRTHRWNPLGQVRLRTGWAYGDIQRAMFGLIPPTKAQNPYWDNAGRRIATAAAVLLSETPGATLHPAAVRRAIGRADYAENFRRMISDARRAGRPYPAAAVDAVLAWLARKGEEGASSVRETVLTALALWDLPEIAAATACSDFDIGRVRSRRMSVFVVAEPADIHRLRPVFGQFFQQLVELNTREEYDGPGPAAPWWRRPRSGPGKAAGGAGGAPPHMHKALVMLDEFWALGEVRVLADASAFTASFGFRVAYVIQSKHQTVTAFGAEGSKNLFLNTGAEILFGGADPEMAREASERMGSDTVMEATVSRPRFFASFNPSRHSESETARRRMLMLPQEINRMSREEMIVLRPGLMPLRLRRLFWYSDPAFRDRGGEPPLVPRMPVEVERDRAEAAEPAATGGAEQARVEANTGWRPLP